MRKALFVVVLLLLPVAAFAQAAAPTPEVDYVGWLDQFIMQLVTAKGGFFVQIGWELAILFGGFRLTFFLIKTAIGARRHGIFDIEGFTILLGELAFVSLLLTYYMAPIPGSGLSVHQIPIALSHGLSSHLTSGMVDPLLAKLHAWSWKMEKPGLSLVDIFTYFIALGIVAVVAAVLFAINANAYFVVGLLVLVGPLFIPLFLLKHFAGKFFKWVDLLFAYSMLGVSIAALNYVFAFFFMAVFQKLTSTDYSLNHLLLVALAWIPLIIGFVFTAIKLPSLNAELFGGSGSMGANAADQVTTAIRQMITKGRAKK